MSIFDRALEVDVQGRAGIGSKQKSFPRRTRCRAAPAFWRRGWALPFLLALAACSPNLTVSKPVSPEHLGSYRVSNPEIDSVVLVEDFEIRAMDTQFSTDDEAAFRESHSVAIANAIQDVIGKRQVFREVRRVEQPGEAPPRFVVSGAYDFTMRLGTQGREWIPFAGTFGARINEAFVDENLELWVTDQTTGQEIFRKSFPSTQEEWTSVYSRANVVYLQPEYLASAANAVVLGIKAEGASKQSSRFGALERKLVELKRLRQSKVITEAEYQRERRRVLDKELGD